MDDVDELTQRFESQRAYLRAVAFRMLGSLTEADDAVQETWLRLARSDTDAVQNLAGWLTTVLSRVCLDMLRSAASRREEPGGLQPPAPVRGSVHDSDPEYRALRAELAVKHEQITEIEVIGDPHRLSHLELAVLD